MIKRIVLLTGEIKTGKSTSLKNWVSNRKSVEGIIQIAEDNERFILNVKNGEQKKLTSDNDFDIIRIGNYKFSKSAFNWSKKILSDIKVQFPEWIVIDEFGKLELEREGLEPEITNLIDRIKYSANCRIIIIVRENLLDRVIEYLKIEKDVVDIITDLAELNSQLPNVT
jgi:nucleoside-triphosphatase THEP1